MIRLFRAIAHVFVPREGNGFRPHLLGRTGFLIALLLILLGAFGSTLYRVVLEQSQYLAAVLPGVLTDLTNADRAEYQLPPLTPSQKLTEVAQLKADDMAAKGYFAHISPEGLTPWYWFMRAGYEFAYAGENLAVDFDDSAAVNAAWMDSLTHRANILGAQYTEIGIATARGTYEGRPAVFVVQAFAQPAAGSSTPVASAARPPEAGAEREQEVVPVEAPQVAGARDTAGSPELFIAVKSVSAPPPEAAASPPIGTPVERASAPGDRLLSSPSQLLTYFYLFLAVLLGVAVVAVSIIEHPQRRRHLIELSVLVVLIGALYALIALGAFSNLAIR